MEREIENIKQAKALVRRYNSITLKEIKKEFLKYKYFRSDPYTHKAFIANYLTGFGKTTTCILCRTVTSCNECIYSVLNKNTHYVTVYCNSKSLDSHITFINIKYSDTPKELHKAFRVRAKYINNLIKTIENGKNN